MTTLVSLLFITMIPIDCKITNFSLYLFVCFFKEVTIIISWCAHLLIGGKSFSQYTSYSLIFSPLYGVVTRKQHEKCLCNQSGYYEKCGILNLQSMRLSYCIKSGRVTLIWCILTLHFTSSF